MNKEQQDIYAQVAIATPVDHLFTYKIPGELSGKVQVGQRLIIPFQRREVIGYLIDINDKLPSSVKDEKLKYIKRVLDENPSIPENILKLIKWMNNYYQSSIGEICKTVLPNKLCNIKFVDTKSRPVEFKDELLHKNKNIEFTIDQTKIYKAILNSMDENKAEAFLLHGVAGSGKTEIYLKVFERILEQDRQGIFLVPEIALTPQLTGRFKERFKEQVGIYHSGLTESQRLDQWRLARNGEISIMVGTRSAIFAPFTKLGLIAVDEEHDQSYKQDDMLNYNARDLSIVRGKNENATVILGSATPSLESYYNAVTKKYNYLHLTSRPFDTEPPNVMIVDMCNRKEHNMDSKFLSNTLIAAIQNNLKNGKQSLLFLNRRGFANFLLCEDCGHTYFCPNCNISLTYHLKDRKLVCHYCDLSLPAPTTCEKCNGLNIKFVGSGTERIESEIEKLFPNARLGRLDRDSSIQKNHRHTILNKMHNDELDILIGTQIIAKGHDFPNVTLVGVINADVALNLPDFRASEKTFQILTQVAGRSGRQKIKGQVIVQTYNATNDSILAAQNHDCKTFYEKELSNRKSLSYPPFSRLANMIFLSNNETKVINTSKIVSKKLSNLRENNIMILGPAPAALGKIRGKWRWQLLIKGKTAKDLNNFLHKAKSSIENSTPSGVKINIDIDPINLL